LHSEIIIAGKLPEENLGGDIAVLFGLVPGLADDTAVVRAQDSFISIVSRDGGDGCGDSSGGGSRLKIFTRIIVVVIEFKFELIL
jgi:hypothetical protein